METVNFLRVECFLDTMKGRTLTMRPEPLDRFFSSLSVINVIILSSLVEARCGTPEAAVYFARRRAKNKAADCVPRDSDVLEGPQDPDLCIGEDNPCPGCVFDGKLCLSAFASETGNTPRQVLAAECLH